MKIVNMVSVYISVSSPSFIMQLLSMKATDGSDAEWCKEVKGSIYDMVVEGFQLLSRWTGRIWEQCAWKFSRPCAVPSDLKDPSGLSDYEKVYHVFHIHRVHISHIRFQQAKFLRSVLILFKRVVYTSRAPRFSCL